MNATPPTRSPDRARHLIIAALLFAVVYVEHLRCSTLPFVLIADLNAGPSAPEMQTLLESGLVSICGNLSQPTYKLTGHRLDYIFVSRQLECGPSNIFRNGPFDHWLVMAEVRSRESSSEKPEKTR